MIGRLARDWKAWVGAVILCVGAFGLISCASGLELKGNVDVKDPALLGKVADAVSEIPGMGWLKPIASVLASLGGAAVLAKRAVKAHDEAPFTAADVASIEAAKPKA